MRAASVCPEGDVSSPPRRLVAVLSVRSDVGAVRPARLSVREPPALGWLRRVSGRSCLPSPLAASSTPTRPLRLSFASVFLLVLSVAAAIPGPLCSLSLLVSTVVSTPAPGVRKSRWRRRRLALSSGPLDHELVGSLGEPEARELASELLALSSGHQKLWISDAFQRVVRVERESRARST